MPDVEYIPLVDERVAEVVIEDYDIDITKRFCGDAIHAGKIGHIKIGHKRYTTRADIAEWIERVAASRRVEPKVPA